eukprot:COSAG05_NODE_4653_length_1422_cov_5.207861_1_plen_316_part_00
MVATASSAASGKRPRGLSKAKKRELKQKRRAKRAAKTTNTGSRPTRLTVEVLENSAQADGGSRIHPRAGAEADQKPAKKPRSSGKAPVNLSSGKPASKDTAEGTHSESQNKSLPAVSGQEERSGILPGPTGQELNVGGHQDDAKDSVTKSLTKELDSAAISDAERNCELTLDLSSMGLDHNEMIQYLTDIKDNALIIDNGRVDEFKLHIYRNVKLAKHPKGPFPRSRVDKQKMLVVRMSTEQAYEKLLKLMTASKVGVYTVLYDQEAFDNQDVSKQWTFVFAPEGLSHRETLTLEILRPPQRPRRPTARSPTRTA